MTPQELDTPTAPGTTRTSTKVSAVVVHWRSVDTVLQTVADLLAQSVPLQRLIVVDHSGDGELNRRLGPQTDQPLRVLEAANRGYGAGMNLGVQGLADDDEFALLCTHEVRLDANVVAALTAAARPEDAMVVPLLGRTSRGTVWSVGGTLDGPSFRPRNIGRGDSVQAWRDRPPPAAQWADGALLLVRCSTFRSIGGFSEDYFMYHEDVELCLRLKAAGWSIRAVPSAVAWQEPSGVPPYLDARNHLKNVWKYQRHSIPAAVLYHWLRAGGDLLEGEKAAAMARLAGTVDAMRRSKPPRPKFTTVGKPR
jgi:GT2 family glycosyltransferase